MEVIRPMKKYDFCGWATKNDVLCGDGRVIRRDAFKDCDGKKVPIVYNHNHDDIFDVLGHAILENRADGVYMYGSLNGTPQGLRAKELVKSKDIDSISIYANKLVHSGRDVVKGVIQEVSLVLAGANPEAKIESYMAHSDMDLENVAFDDDIIVHSSCTFDEYSSDDISHSDSEKSEPEKDESEITVGEVFDGFTDIQKKAVYAMIAAATENEDEDEESKEDDADMKHNIFDKDTQDNTLSHSEVKAIIDDGRRYGSLRESVLAHGITTIENLFPDPKPVTTTPDMLKRDDSWVSEVMNGVHRTPFSRVKSWYTDVTADEARAKGYTKGKKKVEEVIVALKRTTTPTTVYKKQKIDRDDLVDITDFNVVNYIRDEMRMMLNEELARSFVIGDGRQGSSDDKINEQNVRPIWTDDDVYTIKSAVKVDAGATEDEVAKEFIRQCVKSRKDYRGSGNTRLLVSEDVLTTCLLLEDQIGHRLYKTVEELATALRVKKIVSCPVMENQTRVVSENTHTLLGIIVDFSDYNVGADKGGQATMFDDFDIDYNAQKYLIETRISGALIRPKSAIAIERVQPTSELG